MTGRPEVPAAAPSRGSRRGRPLSTAARALLLLLLVAGIIGVVAGAISSASALPPPGPTHSLLFSPLVAVLLLTSFGLFGLVGFIVFVILNRGRGGFGAQEGVMVSAFVLTILLVVLLLAIRAQFGTSGSQPPPGGSGPGSGQNGTTGGPVGNNGTGLNSTNSTLHPSPSSPSSSPLTLAILASVFVVTLGLVVALARFAHRDRGEALGVETTPAKLVKALSQAREALRSGANASARELIIQAYGAMLEALGTRSVGATESLTPREIEHRMLARLGLTPASAQGLRALFEEARYSHHPMTAEQAGAAQRCLDLVLQEITDSRREPALLARPS